MFTRQTAGNNFTCVTPILTGKGTADHLKLAAAGHTCVQSWSVFIWSCLGGAGGCVEENFITYFNYFQKGNCSIILYTLGSYVIPINIYYSGFGLPFHLKKKSFTKWFITLSSHSKFAINVIFTAYYPERALLTIYGLVNKTAQCKLFGVAFNDMF